MPEVIRNADARDDGDAANCEQPLGAGRTCIPLVRDPAHGTVAPPARILYPDALTAGGARSPTDVDRARNPLPILNQ